jgi:predicted glutamine amidotransferase
MCGIIGLYGDDLNVGAHDKKHFMIEGLIVDTLRGYDSTGIACVSRTLDQEVQIYKRDMAGYDFIQMKKTAKLLENMYKYVAILGHNRSATRGNVNDENSHPFQYGSITQVHNGTVTNADSLVPAKDRPKSAHVDSAQVCHAFNYESPEEMLPRLVGGYSLVWWDDTDASLNFARNESKPMYLAFEVTRQAMFFASEAEMLTLLTKRNGIKIQEDIFNLTPMTHYKFKNPKNVREVIKTPFVPAPSQTYLTYPPTSGRSYPGIGSHGTNKWTPTDTTTSTQTAISSVDIETSEPSKSNVTPFRRPDTSGATIVTNGPAHPFKEERFTPLRAGPVKQEAQSDETKNRLRTLMAECKIKDIVIGKPIFWRPYDQGHVNDKIPTSGVMVCEKAKKTESDDDVFFQVFDVPHRRWHDELKDTFIIMEPINYRSATKFQGYPPVLVCRIREDLQQKHFGAKADGVLPSSSAVEWSDDLNAFVEKGTKDGYVEIGTSRKRLVAPAVFEALAKSGCINCNETMTLETKGKFMWIGPNDDRLVCDDCAENPQILEGLQYMQ